MTTVVTRAKRFLAMVATGGDSVTRLLEPARRDGLLEIAGPAAATGPRGDGMPL